MAKLRHRSRRNRLLALLHVARRELGWTEAQYRNWLEAQTGRRSAAQCTEEELERALYALRAWGWPIGPILSPQARLIRGLWARLHRLGGVRNPSLRALRRFVRRMTGKPDETCLDTREANRVIEALKAWKERLRTSQAEGD
ncbi:MAG: regulatory protein GemA [Bacteroidetes bacterium]|nr:regulatory protein GemA [Rhodothermia bacterium]MCS7154748.1 regulatory protein GemA [Bacteroidota bacterium]MCX7907095.1 regulatory protein GemA [Bacteroidota bacterium]MDW8137541.1 regulatory protein GemA [Bacteroidota bacterium]MDW8285505.1 regulatory protein GemA [Bacteroidota bacterium]